MLSGGNAIFKIDKKETENDKFDDLTIITDKSVMKRQIKYSESIRLEKADLSSENYDLALDTLFKSWGELPRDKNIDLRLCLACDFIENNQELDFLVEVDMSSIYHDDNVKLLKVNLESIWPSGSIPIASWRRLRNKAAGIDREEFSCFINDLTIEVNPPKSSTDLTNPGLLEGLVMEKLKLFGVGKYPNNNKSVVSVAMHLILIIKGTRARGEELKFSKIVFDLGLMKRGISNDYFNWAAHISVRRNTTEMYIGTIRVLKKTDVTVIKKPVLSVWLLLIRTDEVDDYDEGNYVIEKIKRDLSNLLKIRIIGQLRILILGILGMVGILIGLQ